jgi:hypothetical protein
MCFGCKGTLGSSNRNDIQRKGETLRTWVNYTKALINMPDDQDVLQDITNKKKYLQWATQTN